MSRFHYEVKEVGQTLTALESFLCTVVNEGGSALSVILTHKDIKNLPLRIDKICGKVQTGSEFCIKVLEGMKPSRMMPQKVRLSVAQWQYSQPLDTRWKKLKELHTPLLRQKAEMEAGVAQISRPGRLTQQETSQHDVALDLLRQAFDEHPFSILPDHLQTRLAILIDMLPTFNSIEGLKKLRKEYQYLGTGWVKSKLKTAGRNANEDGDKELSMKSNKKVGGEENYADTPLCRVNRAHLDLTSFLYLAVEEGLLPDERADKLKKEKGYLMDRLGRWNKETSLSKTTIAFGGHFSHGKSSLLNALIGLPLLPAGGTSIDCAQSRP